MKAETKAKIKATLKKATKPALKSLLVIAIIVAIALSTYYTLIGLGFTDFAKIRNELGDSIWTYVAIVFLQIIQVIFIPISNQVVTIPACLAFPDCLWKVYVSSVIGIEAGTLCLFFIGRFGGRKLLNWILNDKDETEKCAVVLQKGRAFYPIGMISGFIPDDILTTLAGMSGYNFLYVLIVSVCSKLICVATTVWGWGYLTRYWWGWVIMIVGSILLLIATWWAYKWTKRQPNKAIVTTEKKD